MIFFLSNRCNVEPIAPNGQLGAVAMDCDRVVFAGDFPPLPASAPIISYTQKYAGQQSLPSQVIFFIYFLLRFKLVYQNTLFMNENTRKKIIII